MTRRRRTRRVTESGLWVRRRCGCCGWAISGRSKPNVPADLPATEAELQQRILRVAKEFGWLTNRTYRAQLQDGTWRTTATGIGFPDICAVHPVWARVCFFECKGPKGRATPDQKRWIAAFQAAGRAAPGVLVAFVVGPEDWPAVSRLLTRRVP